ncbi:cytochrome c oxidase subunit II [Microvirga puerhi]|uniref:cytochrome-c oxidase n=1 Tax=Microvirga puerhi TaxID=2876078 RepID=A0ABS7VKV5_9HYPH|nr:cytochrome c oxidase subunit II [Microvirga puerhi]MBZ6075705.1 cytochrome c oxidase subunit II [Microvirga puerhi]
MRSDLPLWPDQASAHASAVDILLYGFTGLIFALSVPVFILIIVFAVRYRRGRKVNRRHQVNRNALLEVSWSVIPFLLILCFFFWSAWLFFDLKHPPASALEIDVVAKRWMWKFQHPGGQGEIDELHVPVGEPVKLTMISQDVIHSLYMPALRLKQDVLPGRYTTMWFQADKPGIYRLTCAEFCGTNHSLMGGHFVVMAQQDYARWLQESGVDQTLAAQGETLFRTYGCSGCHSPAATVHAPSLDGLYGRPVALQGGETIIADEQYIRDSILLPQQQMAAGYPSIMPTFKNVLGEDDLTKIVAYIKSLKATQWREHP